VAVRSQSCLRFKVTFRGKENRVFGKVAAQPGRLKLPCNNNRGAYVDWKRGAIGRHGLRNTRTIEPIIAEIFVEPQPFQLEMGKAFQKPL
jgi:hypothetical protein